MNQLVQKHPKAIAALALAGVLIGVYFRLLPTLPTIMQDELVYMIQARHTDQSKIQYPNYLFSWLYQLTLFGGVDYYWLVKLINFVFLFGFGFIVFLISRQFLSFWLALLFSVVSVAGPISLYGSVFMPEAMYIFFAVLSFYLVLRINPGVQRNSLTATLMAALALAATSLVKPHALFLLLGFILFFLVSSKWRAVGYRERLAISAIFGASTILLKLAGGFLLAGPNGLTLFGRYGSLAGIFESLLEFLGLGLGTEVSEVETSSSTLGSDTAELGFLEVALQQFGLHFLAIGFLLAPAWYVFFSTRFSVKSSIAELGLLLLGTMMIIISVFGAWVTVGGDDHTDRILLRYYEYLIPLIYLGMFQVLKTKHPTGITKYVFFTFFSVSAVLIAANNLAGTRRLLADSSFLIGIFENLDTLWVFSGLIILLFWMILGAPTRLVTYSVVVVSAAFIFSGLSSQDNQLRINSSPIGSDFAGQFVRDELQDIPGEEIYVVGSDKQLVEASIFWMDRPGVDFGLYQPGSVIPLDEIPDNRRVIVQMLGVGVETTGEELVRGEDYRISLRD